MGNGELKMICIFKLFLAKTQSRQGKTCIFFAGFAPLRELIAFIAIFALVVLKDNRMDIQAKKLSLIEWLLNLQDEKVLNQIENLKAGTDFWDELTESEKEEINKGIEELDRGEKHSYEAVISNHRKK